MPFIDDGYTLEAVIPEIEDCPAFEITYRPMLSGERTRLAIGTIRAQDSGDNTRMEEWENRTAAAVAKAVTAWTLKDRSGKAVKPTADAVKRIDPRQFENLLELVAGYSKPKPAGDSDEDKDEKN